MVTAVTLAGLSPLLGAKLKSRVPAVLGTIALAILIASYFYSLLIWMPAAAAVLAAAVAGPPVRRAMIERRETAT